MTLASFSEVTKKYRMGETEIIAVNKVSAKITEGDFIVLAGPSGSGKSTFLNLVGCLDKPDSGSITLDQIDITDISLEDLASVRLRKIGYIFQSFNLVPVLTAYENIELPLLFQNGRFGGTDGLRDRVEAVLDLVGLKDRMHHLPSRLSGGQQQRVAIARALAGEPRLIIADEPTANLDSRTAGDIMDFLLELNRKNKTTFVIASHDPRVIGKGSSVFTMRDGSIVS